MTQRAPRQHDPGFLAYLRKQKCLACKKDGPSDAAHIRTASPAHAKRYTGFGEKPSDQWAIPLCRSCHARQHSTGELTWWESHGINPFAWAVVFYRRYGGTGGEPAPRRKINPRKPRHLRAKIQSRNNLRKARK